MRPAVVALFATLTTACLESVLEAPYVLSSGLGEATGLCPTGRSTMLVASSGGTYEIDGSGDRKILLDGPARAVGSHHDRVYVLGTDAIRWGPWPQRGSPLQVQGTLPATGVVDLQAWCKGQVVLAEPSGLTAWDPGSGQTWAIATDLRHIRSLALGPGDGCSSLLVLTDDALLSVTTAGRTVLLDGIDAPRAVNRDRDGRPWIVHGEPPVLSVISDQGLQTMARHLGDPRDLQFGSGELFAPQNAYLADGDGTLDYARVAGR